MLSMWKYGHKEAGCPKTLTGNPTEAERDEQEAGREAAKEDGANQQKTGFGPWMMAQRTRRRPTRAHKGNPVSHDDSVAGKSGAYRGEFAKSTGSGTTISPREVKRDDRHT